MDKKILEKAASRLKFKFPYNLEKWANEMNMLMENYHKHSTWSDIVIIDSPTLMKDFINKCKEYGCQCYFSTEHGYAGEWLKVYDTCKKMGIKFRYGVEEYWVKDLSIEGDRTNCHMVIVARTYNAMRKLNYITSIAHSEGFYYKPRIDLNLLFTLSPEEVYVTSACLAGWAYEDASEIWYRVWKHFGDSFFLEYQCHNTEKQIEINKRIKAMSDEFGIQTIIGLDTHYLDDAENTKRDMFLKAKKLNYPEEDGWYMDFPNGTEVLRRMQEQGVLCDEDIIYSMMNTHVFIDGCEELEDYDTGFKIPIRKEFQDLPYEERSKKLREYIDYQYSLEDKDHKNKTREEAIDYEFGEIEGSGVSDYFLTNSKVVDLAVNKYGGKLTTTSRGSAASYYLSKLCGFTTMDRLEPEIETPIFPERFITKDRILASHQMPDKYNSWMMRIIYIGTYYYTPANCRII